MKHDPSACQCVFGQNSSSCQLSLQNDMSSSSYLHPLSIAVGKVLLGGLCSVSVLLSCRLIWQSFCRRYNWAFCSTIPSSWIVYVWVMVWQPVLVHLCREDDRLDVWLGICCQWIICQLTIFQSHPLNT